MESTQKYDALLVSGARRLTGWRRREFIAEVTRELCDGNPRLAERRFGWGRETVRKGLHEWEHQVQLVDHFSRRGRVRSEEQDPQLAAAIRAIVEPHTQTDPELKSARCYTNLTAKEVRTALLEQGYAEEQLPKERTLRDILNRMNYRLKRIQKGKPLKKNRAHGRDLRQRTGCTRGGQGRSGDAGDFRGYEDEGRLGRIRFGGKTRTDSDGRGPKGWDHDPPAKEK
ncbi:MAG: hypothetical protein PHE55_08710 [Methylococcaceae bacterium]|nr:hypothetical protein [Methylococcaceae bacterium]